MLGGRVVVVLGGAADTLEDDVTLELLRLGVDELRARNDRGGALEPSRTGLGTLDLTAAAQRIELAGVVPATYSSVSVTLGAAAIELRITEDGTTYHLSAPGPITADVRCDDPIALSPGGVLEIHAELDLGELHAALREGPLPPAVDGVVRVDATTAPAVIADVQARAREHWQIDCDDD